ncbi:MAG: hypothetical protein JW720_06165 [Sedimentisphaerales bacterium]|nr:hypothetical protein [Sedimentisphaerales bacterium]
MKYSSQICNHLGLTMPVLLAIIVSSAFASETTVTNAPEPGNTPADVGILRPIPGYPYTFIVDPARSNIEVSATVMGQTDSDQSPATGWIKAKLNPGQSPFETTRIEDLSIDLTEQIDLSFWFYVIVHGTATGTDIGVDMNAPGPVAFIEDDDSFYQPDNLLSARGIFAYDMPVIGVGEEDLSTADPFPSDLVGLVWQDWPEITMQIDFEIEYPLEDGDEVLGTAWIRGTVVATTNVYWALADLYADGLINFQDFAVFASAWPAIAGDPEYDPLCDMINPAEGRINAADLRIIAAYWLATNH